MHTETAVPAADGGVNGSTPGNVRDGHWPGSERAGLSRRSFLAGGAAAAVGVGLGPLGHAAGALAAPGTAGSLSEGDAAILRFLAAAEIIETDLWQQYNELGGIQDSEVPGGSGNPQYTKALSKLDSDMAQYIHDNTDDEFTHWRFLNGYLESRGAEPVDLDRFRNLPSSTARGAQQIGRLTNLMERRSTRRGGRGTGAAR